MRIPPAIQNTPEASEILFGVPESLAPSSPAPAEAAKSPNAKTPTTFDPSALDDGSELFERTLANGQRPYDRF